MRNGTAIISDVVMKFGGAEKVLEALLELYPNAVLYTLFIVPSARRKLEAAYPGLVIRTSFWQGLIKNDKISKYISVIKLFSWIYWDKLDLSEYDVVISSSHSYMSKNSRARKDAFHLAYVHTPPRYLYDEFNEIGIIREWPLSMFFWPIKLFLRFLDKRGSKRPDKLVANSKNVQTRINKYYGRESEIIYPPVDESLLNKYFGQKSGDYYVWVSRVVRQKGIGIAVEVCENMGRKLKVIGGGDELSHLIKKKYKWITFEGAIDDEKKCRLMSQAKALLYTSIDEDFGIVPVEALKMGIPVVSINSGGVREVVQNGKNGILYDGGDANGLREAIIRFEKKIFDPKVCRDSVDKFSKDIFKKKVMAILKYDRKN